jgi:hypothetical protein
MPIAFPPDLEYGDAGMSEFFKVDIRRLSFAELWRISPGFGFIVAALHKLTNLPFPTSTRVPRSLPFNRLEPGSIDADMRRILDESIAAWTALGFESQFLYTTLPPAPGSRAAAAALRSQDGRVLAQTMFVEKQTAIARRYAVIHLCQSRLSDKTILNTSSSRRRMNPPPEFIGLHLPGQSLPYTHKRHVRALQDPRCPASVPFAPEEIENFLVWATNRATEYNVARGVYVAAE